VKNRLSLGSTPPHKLQHEMPKEEDLNNWSHHFSVDTTEDAYLRQAVTGTDLVSFVFGLKVTWALTQAQTALDEEREVDDKSKRDADLEDAKGRLGAKKAKKKKAKSGDPIGDAGQDEAGGRVEDSGGGGMVDDNNDEEQENRGGEDEDRPDESAHVPKLNRVSAASEASAIADPEGATCTVCTLVNELSAKKCLVCGNALSTKSRTNKKKKRTQDSLQALPEHSPGQQQQQQLQPNKKGKKGKSKKKAAENAIPDSDEGEDASIENKHTSVSELPAAEVMDLSAETTGCGLAKVLDDSPARPSVSAATPLEDSDDDDDDDFD